MKDKGRVRGRMRDRGRVRETQSESDRGRQRLEKLVTYIGFRTHSSYLY